MLERAMTAADLLQHTLELTGWTMDDVCRITGRARIRVSAWLRGSLLPDDDAVEAICRQLPGLYTLQRLLRQASEPRYRWCAVLREQSTCDTCGAESTPSHWPLTVHGTYCRHHCPQCTGADLPERQRVQAYLERLLAAASDSSSHYRRVLLALAYTRVLQYPDWRVCRLLGVTDRELASLLRRVPEQLVELVETAADGLIQQRATCMEHTKAHERAIDGERPKFFERAASAECTIHRERSAKTSYRHRRIERAKHSESPIHPELHTWLEFLSMPIRRSRAYAKDKPCQPNQ